MDMDMDDSHMDDASLLKTTWKQRKKMMGNIRGATDEVTKISKDEGCNTRRVKEERYEGGAMTHTTCVLAKWMDARHERVEAHDSQVVIRNSA